MKSKNNLKYFMYCRRSSEDDSKQVQSIDEQTERLTILTNDLGLNLVEVLTESRSAKKPGNRPVFDEMLERIENGEADAILCWQINRLSRNPVDSGKIQWLLQKGILKSIQTIDREYLPSDNALILSITKQDYDRKLQEVMDQLQTLCIEREEHTKADHDYKTTVGTVLSIARRAKQIFDRSEIHEKRQLINFMIQDAVLDDRKIDFTLKKPFNLVLDLSTLQSKTTSVSADRFTWLQGWDSNPRPIG
jgi:hypothetical protein